jgi:hypothetical protein
MEIHKIIVSHKRADSIRTHKSLANCIVCVEESQLEDYKKFNPDLQYLVHPDSIVGRSPKCQWIIDYYKDRPEDVFIIDDDVSRFARVYVADQKEMKYDLTPQEASDLIDDVYNIAKDAGAKLFGFNRVSHPKAFAGDRPIRLTGFITGGASGMIKDGSEIYYPDYPEFVGEDYFLNGINAYHHRYCYIDARFYIDFVETEKGKGGCADYRTEERRKDTYLYLKKHFGDAIKKKKVTTIKKNLTKWEKTLSVPF